VFVRLQSEQGRGERDEREVAARPRLIPGGHPSSLFEPGVC
jgi:hypothetical protein